MLRIIVNFLVLTPDWVAPNYVIVAIIVLIGAPYYSRF